MKMEKKPMALPTVCNMKKRIDATPDYQRPPAWTRKQKQLLMDTILRNYDIPKFYWREVTRADGVKYEVVDGQQRLRAIWEFSDNGYPLLKDSDPIDGIEVAGQRFDDLPMDLIDVFNTYSLDVVIVTDAKEDEKENEVRDMFLRLQNGTTLKAQEKRNAMVGAMRDFVREIAQHSFFESCDFSDSRYTYQHVAAQTILIELQGGPTNVRDADLNKMYEAYTEFDSNGPVATRIRRTYDFLLSAFPARRPELKRYNVINLYALGSLLSNKYVSHELSKPLAEWFLEFEQERDENEKLNENSRDPGLVEYRRLTSYSTDTGESIRGRLEMMERRFFDAVPGIELKDPVRNFSYEQRLAIFRRGKESCQIKNKCDGETVPWDNWHADHIIPHSKGGKTTVANGQVSCPSCNLSKGAA